MSAITLTDVTKIYHRYSGRQFATLKSALLQRSILRDLSPSETFPALSNVSFTVPKGATLGVIGRNGSGKSTALKVVAGITKPTSGRVDVTGRISALIELDDADAGDERIEHVGAPGHHRERFLHAGDALGVLRGIAIPRRDNHGLGAARPDGGRLCEDGPGSDRSQAGGAGGAANLSSCQFSRHGALILLWRWGPTPSAF